MTLTKSILKVVESCDGHFAKHAVQKRVRFGKIEIRDMPYELGEHPPSDSGVPLTIGWFPQETRITHVDIYEVLQADSRRKEMDLKLPLTDRVILLLKSGFTMGEIAKATEEAAYVLKQREASSNGLGLEFLTQVHTRTANKLKKIMRRKQVTGAAA